MQIPASSHFTPLDLTAHYNAERTTLDEALRPPSDIVEIHGDTSLLGIPFHFGPATQPNVILLDQTPITIDTGSLHATYVLFVHAVEDRISNYQDNFADYAMDGNELGDHVADYVLEYADGEKAEIPILRRFAIQS